METKWIVRNQNSKLILFFHGWGMDENMLTPISWDGDVLMLFRYHQKEDSSWERILDSYESIEIYAWSMGLAEALSWYNNHTPNVDRILCINGTSSPIDDECGIPRDTFLQTLKSWSEKARKKFDQRIMGGARNYLNHPELLSQRSTPDLHDELQYLWDRWENAEPIKVPSFCEIILSTDDLIFPIENMRRSWTEALVYEIKAPHSPFISTSFLAINGVINKEISLC